MKNSVITAMLAVTALAHADDKPAAPALPKGTEAYEARTFAAPDGKTLNYRLLRPATYDAAQKYPLVLFLHGAGERGDNNVAQLKHGAPAIAKAQEKFPCFVVAPQCPADQMWADVNWSAPDPLMPADDSAVMKRVLGALTGLQKEFSIDPDRLYVTGLSMGGYGTWDLISRHPEMWAAAVPICGGGDDRKVAAGKNLPIWAFHGLTDKVVIPERTHELIGALKAAGAAPLYSAYPGVGHDSWTPAYQEPELFPWLFAQRRGAAVPFSKTAGPNAQPPSETMPGEGPVQPGIWFRGLWRQLHTKWAEQKAADTGAVVFFGDSITQGWGSLAKDFPGVQTANRGISGDTTRGLRHRLPDVLALKPKAVNLLIGTNDLAQGASAELVAANIQTIVADLQRGQPGLTVVWNKIMPRKTAPGLFPDKIQAVNAAVTAAFSGKPNIVIVDTWAAFDDGSGSCKKEEFPDMLHPNEAGYAKWKALVEPVLSGLK